MKVNDNLPKTWEEFCRTIPLEKEWYIDNFSRIEYKAPTALVCYRSVLFDKKLLPNHDTAKAFLALMQLIQLRDCYRQGWKPDYDNLEKHYYILNDNGSLDIGTSYTISHILLFKDFKTCSLFLDNFKDLIEQAKELI